MASALPRAGEGDDVSWMKSLACLPKFSYFVIHDHLKDCGKKEIGDKAYKFFPRKLCSRCVRVSTIRVCEYRKSPLSSKPKEKRGSPQSTD